MFNTLHEFTFHTEAVSYVLSLLVLLAFIPFWRFLVERQPD